MNGDSVRGSLNEEQEEEINVVDGDGEEEEEEHFVLSESLPDSHDNNSNSNNINSNNNKNKKRQYSASTASRVAEQAATHKRPRVIDEIHSSPSTTARDHLRSGSDGLGQAHSNNFNNNNNNSAIPSAIQSPQHPQQQPQPQQQQPQQQQPQPPLQQQPQQPQQQKGRAFSGAEIDAAEVKLVRLRGAGCFGKVWEGEVHNKRVAIKVPLIQNLDRNQLRSLRTEILIMSNNPHPNIILFMGACTQPGRLQIVTELLDGDLEALLHDKRVHLSLFDRLCMAKDAALGMNWLHSVRPAIIHRDLKTANLLFKRTGTAYTIKVCDFGLSAIKPPHSKQLRDGQDGAKGTPLYMAPEVMASKDFNEKADVYSFGICLWEIFTRLDPFPHHSDYDAFVKAVCTAHERPPIPDNCPLGFKQLTEACWHPVPESRPDFAQVCERLDDIMVDAAILDLQGREFWKTFFLKHNSVPWDGFVRVFYQWLNIPLPALHGVDATAGPSHLSPVSTEDINYCVFRALVDSEKKRPATEPLEVNIEWFGNLLNWFGPVGRGSRDGFTVLDRMRFLCAQEWFHGNIDAHEAEVKLSQAPIGTYLVRFSTNVDYPGAFTITRVSPGGTIGNVRIKQQGGFTINGDKVYGSLVQLLLAVENALGLTVACTPSPFLHLFSGQQQPGSGYEAPAL